MLPRPGALLRPGGGHDGGGRVGRAVVQGLRHRDPVRGAEGGPAAPLTVKMGPDLNPSPFTPPLTRYEGPKGGPGMKEMLNPTAIVMGAGLGQVSPFNSV